MMQVEGEKKRIKEQVEQLLYRFQAWHVVTTTSKNYKTTVQIPTAIPRYFKMVFTLPYCVYSHRRRSPPSLRAFVSNAMSC